MLKKDTLRFLKELKENNTREWFTENKDWYENSRADVVELVGEIIKAIIPFDPTIGNTEPKKCLFRIHRDTRFSNEKTPYKTNFGAVIGARDSGYYIHISPDESFIACGYYMLPPDQLRKIRKGIYSDYSTLREILDDKDFKKEIGDFGRDEDILKRVPNGFDKEHPAAEYVKLKRFYVMKPITEKQLYSDDFATYAASIFKLMQPLKTYLTELANE